MSHQISFEEFCNYSFSKVLASDTLKEKELKCIVSPTEMETIIYIVKHKGEIVYSGKELTEAIEAYNNIDVSYTFAIFKKQLHTVIAISLYKTKEDIEKRLRHSGWKEGQPYFLSTAPNPPSALDEADKLEFKF